MTCSSLIDNYLFSTPFDIKTIKKILGKDYKDTYKKFKNKSFSIIDLKKSNDKNLVKIYKFLYYKNFKPYSLKHWGVNPEDLDSAIFERVKIYFCRKKTYFNDKWSIVPKKGYDNFFKSMVSMNLKINYNFNNNKINFKNNKALINNKNYHKVIFTCPIDELFNFEFGKLEYRSILFYHYYIDSKNFALPYSVIALPNDNCTRMWENNRIAKQKTNKKLVVVEKSIKFELDKNIRMYPLLTNNDIIIYNLYREKIEKLDNVILHGRLAKYRYFDMDKIIEESLRIASEI